MHTNLFLVIIFIDRTATSTRLLTKETKRQLVEDSGASIREKNHAFWIYSRSTKVLGENIDKIRPWGFVRASLGRGIAVERRNRAQKRSSERVTNRHRSKKLRFVDASAYITLVCLIGRAGLLRADNEAIANRADQKSDLLDRRWGIADIDIREPPCFVVRWI